MTKTTLNLLSCPFCHSEAELNNYIVEAVIRCLECKATITRGHGQYTDDGVRDVVLAWNRRGI